MPSWGLDPRRLAELDTAFLGRRVIVAEFALGVIGGAALGLLSLVYGWSHRLPIRSWTWLIGIELTAISINYLPLLIEALRLYGDRARIEAARVAIKQAPEEARSYGLRQGWILVPGAVVAFALMGRAGSAPGHRG